MIDNKQSILINVESLLFSYTLRVATPIYQISEEKFFLKNPHYFFYVLKREIFAESLATDGRSKMDIVHAIVIAMKILLNM